MLKSVTMSLCVGEVRTVSNFAGSQGLCREALFNDVCSAKKNPESLNNYEKHAFIFKYSFSPLPVLDLLVKISQTPIRYLNNTVSVSLGLM